MKEKYFFVLFLVSILSCHSDNNYQKLGDYLIKFEKEINNYKVVAFVPVDGCSSCLISTIEYSKSADDRFLLVLNSISEKTNKFFIKLNKIDTLKIISDSHNLAGEMGFVPLNAPRYVFINNKRIVKSIDLTDILDKSVVLKDVDMFLNK